MTAQDPALTRALDDLTTQVNQDNILAVHKVFHDHADELRTHLMSATVDARLGLCGGDPVSKDAAQSFNGKIDDLLKIHWAHQVELATAADHLRSIAQQYGITEEEIARSLVPSDAPS